MYSPPITCNGWRRMWITYSCDVGGRDDTTVHVPPEPRQCKPGKMLGRDIPLDGGWIFIRCSTCITIHKVMAGCVAGPTNPVHMSLVGHLKTHVLSYLLWYHKIKNSCEGKTACDIYPNSVMFDVACHPTWWRRMWITYSCSGVDRTTYNGKPWICKNCLKRFYTNLFFSIQSLVFARLYGKEFKRSI